MKPVMKQTQIEKHFQLSLILLMKNPVFFHHVEFKFAYNDL